jgi:ATP-dependent Clp protease ATP-binding subunit ClpA
MVSLQEAIMFERYTESARRIIFFARYEASRFGSSTIETEHMLLGLLREDKKLIGSLLNEASEHFQQKIEGQIAARPKIPTSIDLPLSNECKRILAYANEEAEGLEHHHIGSEHLLLGISRESGCRAARLLSEAGADIESLRERIAKSGVSDKKRSPIDFPGALPFTEGLSHSHQMEKDAEGRITEGRMSQSQRGTDGSLVVETHQFFAGHQISVKEHYRLSDDRKTLLYSHEVVGPRPEQRHEHTVSFDVAS